MTEEESDKKAAAAIREIENRLVWFVSFLVLRAVAPQGGTESAATGASEALDAYQSRFPPIKP